MQFFSNLKIGTRIIAILLLFAGGLVGVTLIGLNGLRTYDDNVKQMQSMADRALYALKSSRAMSDTAAEARAIYSSTDPQEMQRLVQRLNAATAELEAAIPKYEAAQPADRRAAFAARKQMMLDYAKYRREISRIALASGGPAARDFGNQPQYATMRETLDKDLDDAIDRNDRGIVEISTKLDAFLELETQLLIGISAAIVIGSLLLGLAISILTITRPLKQLTGSLDALGNGDTKAEIFGLTRKDELGAIARSTHKLVAILLNAARSESGLRNVTANVMVADNQNNIVYCNKAVLDTLRNAQADIRKDLPQFDADKLIGQNVDIFHKNPAHQQRMLAALTGTHEGRIKVGGRTFDLTVNPAVNGMGERVGTVVEWADRTDQLRLEAEVIHLVEAASAKGFTERVDLDGRTGFIKDLGLAINSMSDQCQTMTGEIATTISAIAEGDLTKSLTKDYPGIFGQLKTGANALTERLTNFAGQLSESAQTVHFRLVGDFHRQPGSGAAHGKPGGVH